MLNINRIVKVQVNAMNGQLIVEADSEQLSFPRLFVNDVPVNNIMMIKGKGFPEIDSDVGVYVIAYMKNGDRVQYVGRVKMSLDNQLNVQIRDDYGTLMEERRRFFKVQSDIKCVISGVERDGTLYEYDIPIISRIKNLSIGGVFIEGTDPPFCKDDLLLINFKVTEDVVGAMAKVLRLQLDADGGLLGYGCEFANVDQRQEGLLAKSVYEIQLKQRQLQREKEYKKSEGEKRVKGF